MVHFEPSKRVVVGDAGPGNTVEVAALRPGSFKYCSSCTAAGGGTEPDSQAQRHFSPEQKLQQTRQEGHRPLTSSTHGECFSLGLELFSWTIFSCHTIHPQYRLSYFPSITHVVSTFDNSKKISERASNLCG